MADLFALIQNSGPNFNFVRETILAIQQEIQKHNLARIAFSFNGGKDCTVLLHLLRAALAPPFYPETEHTDLAGMRVIYFGAPNEFPEIISFMNLCCTQYHFTISETPSKDFKEGMDFLVNNKGIKAVFMGQRRVDPGGKSLEFSSLSDPGWPPFLRINPILEWTYHQVWLFLKTFHLPYCSLYDEGYTSLGSTLTTIQNPALRYQLPDGSWKHAPASQLADSSLERAGRTPSIRAPSPPPPSNRNDNITEMKTRSPELPSSPNSDNGSSTYYTHSSIFLAPPSYL